MKGIIVDAERVSGDNYSYLPATKVDFAEVIRELCDELSLEVKLL